MWFFVFNYYLFLSLSFPKTFVIWKVAVRFRMHGLFVNLCHWKLRQSGNWESVPHGSGLLLLPQCSQRGLRDIEGPSLVKEHSTWGMVGSGMNQRSRRFRQEIS